ncbi:MAG: glycosyltransferase family 2 protein [Bacilli bacterium]
MNKKISLIIPCYNEEEMIFTLYEEITKVISKIPQYEFTLLFVNDGSKDKTLPLIKEKAALDSRVKFISFSRNFGKESSMLAGLEASLKMNVDACLFMDADLQDPPSIMIDFIRYYEEGYKYIYARNKDRKGQAFLKKVFSTLFYKVYAVLTGDKNTVSSARDFALLDKDVMKAFVAFKDKRRYSKGISSSIGFKRKCVEYEYHDRAAGTTKWSFKKLFKYGMTGIEQFSRIYELVPNLICIFLFLGLITQLVIGLISPYSNMWLYMSITLGTLLITIILKYILKVVYDVRDQLLNRPAYLSEESNLDD